MTLEFVEKVPEENKHRDIKQSERGVGQLFRQYQSEISNTLYKRLGSREEADDLTQEAFERYSSASRQKPIGNPRAYLYRVAKNLVVDHFRRVTSRNRVFVRCDDPVEAQDPNPSTEQNLIQSSNYRQLREAIGKLPPKCRQVFILRKLEGLSYAQIADKMDISVAAVEKHVVRGLKACRFELTKNGDWE
ncbi:RNA polymerase sigma factor [Paremcibacter congregatus]|uniref:RNA polymerase sigma factor n=1 Tax=Paremcibacter congregatus TaxID=2043170 RepID=UPI0030EC972D